MDSASLRVVVDGAFLQLLDVDESGKSKAYADQGSSSNLALIGCSPG